MPFSRPSIWPAPGPLYDAEATKEYLDRLYRALVENDRTGELFRDRAPSADLKALITRPEWHGAKGDGATDDYVAIQAAITAAGAGAVVLKPGATYIIGTGLTITHADCAFVCIGGSADIETTADIDALTISAESVKVMNINITKSGASTKAGIKMTDGAKICYIGNCQVKAFLYDFELYSSTATGVAYNYFDDIYAYNSSQAGSIEIYLHVSGSGWVNENTFSGGTVMASTAGIAISAAGNQNKFLGTSIEVGTANDFLVKDYGANVYSGCRIESVDAFGVLLWSIYNNRENNTRLIGNYYACKQPFYADRNGCFQILDYAYTGIIRGSPTGQYRVATTVDADSASGQKVLNVASTTGLYVKETLLINEGGAREEYGTINSITDGVSVTLETNLKYTHTAAQADNVYAKENRSGIDWYRTWDKADLFVYGKKIATFDNAGELAVSGDVDATSFSIGANTLTASEFAYLDGHNQSVNTTSTPQFAKVGVGAAVSGNYRLYIDPLLATTGVAQAIYVGGPDRTVSTAETNYFIALALNNLLADIDSGVTDSGYRVAANVNAYINDTDFQGTLDSNYGLRVSHGILNAGASGARTINYSYGLYIAGLASAGTITNPFGIYQATATDRNYFAGNIGIGTFAYGMNSTQTICQKTGTPPASNVTDCYQQYSADIVAGNAAPHFRTEAGHIVKLYSQAHVADAVTAHAVTDPGDAPADADALREDLVANVIPSIETQLNNLGTKINSILTALETNGQLLTS